MNVIKLIATNFLPDDTSPPREQRTPERGRFDGDEARCARSSRGYSTPASFHDRHRRVSAP